MIKYCLCDSEETLGRMKEYVYKIKGSVISENGFVKGRVNYVFDFRELHKIRDKIRDSHHIICFVLEDELEGFKNFAHRYLNKAYTREHNWLKSEEICNGEELLCENSSKDWDELILRMRLDPLRIQ